MVASTARRPKRLEEQNKLSAPLLSFLLAAAGAAAIFLPFLIIDKGFFLYCGDFNEQQIPFYMYVNGFLKSAGGGTWSWATDMGSSVVNAYSFYNFGSPFLWLSLLLPSRWMPYAMVPLFILKFACIAGACCLWLSRYAKTRNMAVISSVLYAFCGFNVYNIFFNHMLDPVAIFPLMLWALDGYMHERRRGWFALFVGLALVNSYFFFIGNVVFLLIYFFTKLLCGEYKLNLPDFGWLVFEAVIGVGIGMVLALPSLLDLMNNPRVDNFANGMGLVLYGNVQQYANILTSVFLPPDPPYMPNLFPEGAIKWTSMSFFLPLIGASGVFAYFKSRKGGSVKKVIAICFVMALVPILNSSFYAFNQSYYARWYYMPILIACLATLHSLEEADVNLEGGARLTVILTGVYVIFGLLPNKVDGEWKLGVAQQDSKFWLTWLTAIFGAAIFYILVKFYRGKVRFAPLLLGAVMGFSVFYSIIHIALGKFPQWERDADYREMQWEGSAAVDLPDYSEGFYRIDTYEAHDNLGLWLNRSSIRTFNSTVNASIMEFYPMVGVKRDVSSKPETEYYALRGLLGVRYTLVPLDEVDNFLNAPGVAGWVRIEDQGPYAVFENENFVPLGFTYDQYVTMDNLKSIQVADRSDVLMRAIGLDEEQLGRYRRLFEDEAVSWEVVSPAAALADGTTGGWYAYESTDFHTYTQDCADRRATASYETSADAKGFRVKIDMEKENLVFFGVPYDKGWTATVNGKEVPVEKVSGGMMAVLAPAGDNEIVFTYRTPGLREGAAISIVSLLLLAGYLLLHKKVLSKRAPAKKAAKGQPVMQEVTIQIPTGSLVQGAAEAGGKPRLFDYLAEEDAEKNNSKEPTTSSENDDVDLG